MLEKNLSSKFYAPFAVSDVEEFANSQVLHVLCRNGKNMSCVEWEHRRMELGVTHR